MGDSQRLEFFEKRIRPVLVQSCYKCHSDQSEEPAGGLRLDSRAALRAGGESGPAVIPGQPTESLLIEALRYESLQMPPANQLPPEVVADFVEWIQHGAVDPRNQPDELSSGDSWPTILRARRDWWSLRPAVAPPIPDVAGKWPRLAMDHFVLARLEDVGLAAPPPAPHATLIRRLSLVLTGLPPTPDEVDQFVHQSAADADAAYRELVDRLLGSPQFGERWARHWMDVVRFTETHGNEWNYEVHHAWRYRDYLIRAFNSDVPYDQFVREHIAGDLLKEPRWNKELEINESIIGTSFFRFGEVNHDDCVSLTAIGYDILDGQIDTLSKAFQATTIACARCHHHKIDAVSTYDYYALLGILKSSRLTAQTIDADTVNAEPLERLRALKPRIRAALVRHWLPQIRDTPRYLLAADAKRRQSKSVAGLVAGLDELRLQSWQEALESAQPGMDDPLGPWLQLGDTRDVRGTWVELARSHKEVRLSRSTFNENEFETFVVFRDETHGDRMTSGTGAHGRQAAAAGSQPRPPLHDHASPSSAAWQRSGQGLRVGPAASGEFTISAEPNRIVEAILPAGCYTHLFSQKLNGTLRSPVLRTNKKHVSLQVLGEKTSAVRLVSNNCQLNYANYRALTSPQLTWVTFRVPEDARTLQTFAELVTKFDNPKFPDQLGTLGGDKKNDRIPWAEAAVDPRSYFGIVKAVFHDGVQPPQASLAPQSRLFATAAAVRTRADVANRYADSIRSAVVAWSAGTATDDDVYWLSWIVESGLLDHSRDATPELAALVDEYLAIEETLRLPRLVPGLSDFGDGDDHPLLDRGSFAAPKQPVPRRYLEVFSKGGVESFTAGSGRWQLAGEIASARNPLTARVMVNRVWHHVFGAGIVRTVDDFGRVGELPSHPELLDHLASRFAAPVDAPDRGMGWSIKRLIREMVLSQTFRSTNRAGAAGKRLDPNNRLLHHYPVRRMEAEAIRDSILTVSRRLDRAMYGMSIHPFREASNPIRRLFAGPLDGDGRRSVYLKANLMEGPKFLDSFNFPGGKITQGRRDVTNVPAQALTLLNDPFVLQQAEVWSDRLLSSDSPPAVSTRLNQMLRDALGRSATPEELDRFEGFVHSLSRAYREDEVMSNRQIWKDVSHLIFNMKEFIYIP